MKHLVEMQYLERINKSPIIEKIDKDTYRVLVGNSKGEIREFSHSENRGQLFSSLRKTFKRLRYLINNNFQGGKNELFVTLTYAENMQDTKRLYRDFDVFMKRFRRVFSDVDYLSVVEPQGRGAWHIHLLLRFNSVDEIYIDNSWLREKWGQGFVNIHRLQQVDNLGAYLTAYLADFVVNEDENGCVEDIATLAKAVNSSLGVVEKEIDINGKKVKKKILKGGRLCFYPPGMNLYRKSKGIVMPPREFIYLDEDTKKSVVGFAEPDYTKSLEMLKADTDEHFNTLIYESYNLRRK